MKRYTLGFVFTPDFSKVLLLQKTHPEWQKGKLNGIGGKIEEGESSLVCMVREAREESAIQTSERDWIFSAMLQESDVEVDVYGLILRAEMGEPTTTTEEPVAWHAVVDIPNTIHSNGHWLVYLVKDKLMNDKFKSCTVQYR